jgi:hypothetical protein
LCNHDTKILDEYQQDLNFEEIETDLKLQYRIDELNQIETYAKDFYMKNTKTIEIFFRGLTKDNEGNTCREQEGKLYTVFFP